MLGLAALSLSNFNNPSGYTVIDMTMTSLLQQPGPKKFKLFRIDLKYKAKTFKVLQLSK